MFSFPFIWWFLYFLLGLINLPLTSLVFKKLYDRGYAFAKVFTLIILAYLVWLGAILKIVPFTGFFVFFFLALIFVLNLYLLKKHPEVKNEIRPLWRIFAFEEILFFTGLFLWAYVRSHQPDIHGLEKFMDFGFINAILRSRYFPPHDMWLAGRSINYYYFGHLETAVLTKLSGINSAITYNLTLASLCGLVLSTSFSLTSNLINWLLVEAKKRLPLMLLGGLISAVLLTFGGNLQLLYHWLQEKSLTTYWYPDATRFIIEKFGAMDNTIHEFPIYSFVVADLHGHLLNIPQVFFILALLLSLAKTLGTGLEKPDWLVKIKRKLGRLKLKFPFGLARKTEKNFLLKVREAFEQTLYHLSTLLILGLTLGVAFMTNAWDYPIYLLFCGAVILWFNLLGQDQKDLAILQTGFACLWLLGASVLFSLPFHLHFDNIAQGIALVDFHSPPWMLLFLWGFPLFTSICFLALIKKKGSETKTADYFALALIVVSWFLILVPEILRIKDIYVHNHQRANTMFKLTYQSFMVFRLLSGYILIRIMTSLKKSLLKKAFLLVFLAGTAVLLTYPRYAIKSYYNNLKDYQGLDGLKYLSTSYPDDYQAILWLNENAPDNAVIVEAVGESYTDYARVSANTGLATVLGWRVHEWLWRGGFDIAGKRTEEVTKIYTSIDKREVSDLLRKYQVQYVFLGKLEKEAYPELNEANFTSLGQVVYASGKTRIYQIN